MGVRSFSFLLSKRCERLDLVVEHLLEFFSRDVVLARVHFEELGLEWWGAGFVAAKDTKHQLSRKGPDRERGSLWVMIRFHIRMCQCVFDRDPLERAGRRGRSVTAR
jgi:hypothetical protein